MNVDKQQSLLDQYISYICLLLEIAATIIRIMSLYIGH